MLEEGGVGGGGWNKPLLRGPLDGGRPPSSSTWLLVMRWRRLVSAFDSTSFLCSSFSFLVWMVATVNASRLSSTCGPSMVLRLSAELPPNSSS